MVWHERVGVWLELLDRSSFTPAPTCHFALHRLEHTLMVFQVTSLAFQHKFYQLTASELASGVGHAFNAIPVAQKFNAQIVEVLGARRRTGLVLCSFVILLFVPHATRLAAAWRWKREIA